MYLVLTELLRIFLSWNCSFTLEYFGHLSMSKWLKKHVRVTDCLHQEGDSKFLTIYPQEGSINFLCKFDVCMTVHHSYNNVDNQLDATITVYQQFQSAQHVSGDGFAHPQEHWTVFKACGIMHPRCCRPVVWMRWNWRSTVSRLPAGNIVCALYHKL